MTTIIAVTAFAKVFLLIGAGIAGLGTGLAIRAMMEGRKNRGK